MGGANDDDDSPSANWPWNDRAFQHMQADHERFMKQLRDEGQRLQQQLEKESFSTSSVGSETISNSGSPFSSFKKFVDDNFNTLTQSFRNFPSNLADIRARMQREQELRKQEERDISRRWTGSSDSPDHIRMEVERSTVEEKDDAHASTQLLLSESWRRNAHVPLEKIEALYSDPNSRFGDLDRFASPMLSWGGACYYMPESGNNLPSTRSWAWTSAPAPRWLSVDWFKRSPYSPIQMEAHPQAGVYGSMWREAFEDLLNATLDKPMDPRERVGVREPHGKIQSTHQGPGLDWMLSLQCRGILPPQLPRFWNDIRKSPELRQKSLSQLLSQETNSVPWSTDPSLIFHTPIHRDFSELMSEIGVKSTPDSDFQEFDTFPSRSTHSTEQDMYESTCKVQSSQPALPFYPPADGIRTGLSQSEKMNLQTEMWDAFEAKDVSRVVDILETWSDHFPDIRGLVHDALEEVKDTSLYAPPQEWVPVLAKALRHSALDSQDYNKWALEFIERIAELDKASSEEKARRRSALRRLEDCIGHPHNYAHTLWTTEEIEESVARMEQESTNLAYMTGEQVPVHHTDTTSTSAPVKKPDVLSALTTTHTTRMPDGTVTTKVVLKQRFADGREETQESVHTAHESASGPLVEESPKKKGWFWS